MQNAKCKIWGGIPSTYGSVVGEGGRPNYAVGLRDCLLRKQGVRPFVQV